MKKVKKFTRLVFLVNVLIILVSLFLNSCIQGSGPYGSNLNSSLSTDNTKKTVPAVVIPTGTDTAVYTQRVELSHLVDPFDGTYKKKLTIPKNFKGNLYLAGLNVASLSNKLVFVRFNFGIDKQSVTLNATVARAPGIIPKTDIQVLVIDMNTKPLAQMRLGYDLYDYNDYASDATKDIVTDPRDGGLYCRGLNLEDDPTFTALSNSSTCSTATDKCLYTYAKVLDSALYTDQAITVSGVAKMYRLSSVPTRSQVWKENAGVSTPAVTSLSTNVCLPDDNNISSIFELFGQNFGGVLGDQLLMFSGYYRGPYKPLNESAWQITGDALYNTTSGLFQIRPMGSISQISPVVSSISNTGFRSLLFPRAGKLSLGQGVSYLGSSDHIGPRTKMLSDSTGTTAYVDGCNLRALNFDPNSNEGINSCNVNASVEVFYLLDGKEVSIAIDKTIKLQLIRSSLTNYLGKEVLTTSFKRCESSTNCGADECCFNSRCWSKDLVTQCLDHTPIIGNQQIGASCISDYECGSLCCNQATGACAPHNPNGSNPMFCSKSGGQQCVAKEFCQQVPVTTCKIVKTGFNQNGTTSCALRCPAVMTYGDCKSGSCVPPTQPAIPVFDPNNCSAAVDP